MTERQAVPQAPTPVSNNNAPANVQRRSNTQLRGTTYAEGVAMRQAELDAGAPVQHKRPLWAEGHEHKPSPKPTKPGANKDQKTPPDGKREPQYKGALNEEQLAPVAGELGGDPLYINDNPETFRHFGVLGSTIAPMPGRGDDNVHEFNGSARMFALSQNGTGKNVYSSIVIKNCSSKRAFFTMEGIVYCHNTTPVTADAPPKHYKQSAGFQGPQAIAGASFRDKKPKVNGYVKVGPKWIEPGKLAVINEAQQWSGSESFTLVDIKANPGGTPFAIANVASVDKLGAADMADLDSGKYESAGCPDDKDYADAKGTNLGRPNGVVKEGSVFKGAGKTFVLTDGMKQGELLMATSDRNASKGDNAGVPTDTTKLAHVPKNANGTETATLNEGNYGVSYDLTYNLVNPTYSVDPKTGKPKSGGTPLIASLFCTAPPRAKDERGGNPLGATLMFAMKVDGKPVDVRVDSRGLMQKIGEWEVAGTAKSVRIELVNMGNTAPPAGLEVRARKK